MIKNEISYTVQIYAVLTDEPKSIEEIQSGLPERLLKNQFGVAMQSLMLQGAVDRVSRGMYARRPGVTFDPKPGRHKGVPSPKKYASRAGKKNAPRVRFTKRDVDSMIAATKRLREENERRESGPITVKGQPWSTKCEGYPCASVHRVKGAELCAPCTEFIRDRATKDPKGYAGVNT